MERLFTVGQLTVHQSNTAEEMGIYAASQIRNDILRIAKEKAEINMMFAAAPSQITTLDALVKYDDIPWARINAFHMDEYIGISADAPQSFRNFLIRHIFGIRPFKSLNLINGDAHDPMEVVCNYSEKLRNNKMDIVVLGIGESGHIAFNDPPLAKFDDEELVRIISLSDTSRKQQVHDKCFSDIDEVPLRAITVTIPVFVSADILHCIVPSSTKAVAVKKTLENGITEAFPATVLRSHRNSSLYIDNDSASLL